MADRTDSHKLLLDTQSKRRQFLKLTGVAGLGALAGCLGDDSDDDTATDDTDPGTADDGDDAAVGDDDDGVQEDSRVVIGVSTDRWDLLPGRNTDFDANLVYELVYDNLVDLNPDIELEPQLAHDWEEESDTQVVFHLEEDVLFHNGEEFTAENVQFTWEWFFEQDNPRQHKVAPIEDVVVEDDHTVRFDMGENPYAAFYYNGINAVLWPLSIDAWDDLGDDYNSQPVGTGPYEFTEWQSGDFAVLTAFDDYWQDGYPNIDEIEFRVLPDETTKTDQAQTGDVDLVDFMPPARIDSIEEAEGVSVESMPGVESARIDFNFAVEPFDDRDVRRALAWAVDKEAILDVTTDGTAEPAKSILPPSLPHYADDFEDFNHPHGDPDEAQSLLEETGHTDLSLEILTSTSERHEQTATLLQNQWQAIGVDVDIQSLDGETFWSEQLAGEYEVAVSEWSWFGDPETLLMLHHPDSLNVWNMDDEELSQMLEAQQVEFDPDARGEIVRDIQEHIYTEAISIYTHYPLRIQAVADRLEGFEQYPSASFRSLTTADVQ